MQDRPKTLVEIVTPCVAILAVAAMEITALIKGIDGASLAGAMAIVGGIGGYGVKTVRERFQYKQEVK